MRPFLIRWDGKSPPEEPAPDHRFGLALLPVAEHLGKVRFVPHSPWVTLRSILAPPGAAGKEEELSPGIQEHC